MRKINIKSKQECEYCLIKETIPNLYIPCVHFIAANVTRRPMLTIDNFGSRWINYLSILTNYEESEYVTSSEVSYSFLQSKFQKYFSIINNNETVKNKLMVGYSELDTLQIITETEESLTKAQKGCIQKQIFKNVNTGRQRTKNQYSCSECHKIVHNKSKCPKKLWIHILKVTSTKMYKYSDTTSTSILPLIFFSFIF